VRDSLRCAALNDDERPTAAINHAANDAVDPPAMYFK
jgi:hypothetical protein